MSSNLVLALILLPVMGALIAWAGDVIGYRLGKSRRSVFGLRPRSTARLIGALVGAVLPLAGLLFAMAVSQDARDAVLKIGDLREQARQLSVRIPLLHTEITRAETDARSERDRAREANLSRVNAERQLGESQKSLGDARSQLQTTQQTLQTARSSLAEARSSLASAHSDLTSARNDLSSARNDLSRAKEDVSRAKSDLAAARGDMAKAKTDLATADRDLAAAREELNTRRKQLASAQLELENADRIHREIQAAQEQLKNLGDQLATAEQSLASYKIGTRAILTQDVAFEPGEEIIRAIVEAGRSEAQLEVVLAELLNYASAAAGRQGIALGPNERTVQVVSPVPPGISPGAATEADIIRAVAREIHQGTAPTYVVIVRALGRAFKQQAVQMAAEFWVAPNKVIFRAGETIVTTEIDGSLPRAMVFQEIWQTMTSIRKVAADRGMLPNPRTGRFGEVPAEQLLAAMDRVLEIHGPAKVSAVVVQDARRAAPEDAPMLVKLNVTPRRQP